MRALLLVASALLLSACGFQLRGSYPLPFATLHLAGIPEVAELHAQIKRTVEAGSGSRIVGTPKEAEATLTLMLDQPQKNILSLDASGRVREFQLVRTFQFRVNDPSGATLIAPSQIIVRRDISFSDAQVLSKEAEEALLWRDIQEDLVQQLLRRLAAARRAAPAPSPSASPAPAAR